MTLQSEAEESVTFSSHTLAKMIRLPGSRFVQLNVGKIDSWLSASRVAMIRESLAVKAAAAASVRDLAFDEPTEKPTDGPTAERTEQAPVR